MLCMGQRFFYQVNILNKSVRGAAAFFVSVLDPGIDENGISGDNDY